MMFLQQAVDLATITLQTLSLPPRGAPEFSIQFFQFTATFCQAFQSLPLYRRGSSGFLQSLKSIWGLPPRRGFLLSRVFTLGFHHSSNLKLYSHPSCPANTMAFCDPTSRNCGPRETDQKYTDLISYSSVSEASTSLRFLPAFHHSPVLSNSGRLPHCLRAAYFCTEDLSVCSKANVTKLFHHYQKPEAQPNTLTFPLSSLLIFT